MRFLFTVLVLIAGLRCLSAGAQVPALINFQGRLVVRGASFDGTGQFKLALANADGSSVYWRNAPDADSDGEPDAAVSLSVIKGIYSIAIGDTSMANMAALPAAVFANSGLFLRVWFNDGTTGFQRLLPDQRIAAVGYAMMAENVADGTITTEKLAPDLAADLRAFPTVSADSQDTTLVSRGYGVFMTVPAPAWVNGDATGAPTARAGHTAVWAGQELLVWGGEQGGGVLSSGGGAYDPQTDQWRILSPINAPAARRAHSAVWTGTEMIIWGGLITGGYANTGARFDNTTQNWSALTTTGAPAGRQGHVTVWTGTRMAVLGGLNANGLLSDCALFDPSTGQWTALAAANPPSARQHAAAVWTGNRLIVWGGQGASVAQNDGAQLSLDSGVPDSAWQPVPAPGAPSARYGHTAVWTGQGMIVWGGYNGSAYSADGASYDPNTGIWTALPSANAPSARAGHVVVWTGAEMIILGGENASGALSTGAAYDPAANKWRPLTNPGSPVARAGATAVWSGSDVLIFGGQANGQPLAALQKLNPQPAWYFYRKL